MLKVFLLHVKLGYEDRLAHMTKLLSSYNLTFELVLDGDIPDLTKPILDTYFAGFMNSKSAHASCGYKHIVCYEAMVREDIDYALILEDDVFFLRDFEKVLQLTIAEREEDKSPWYVGFEASHLRLVPRSQRRKNITTYQSSSVQCTGAYLINKATAEVILQVLENKKCDLPIDLFLDNLQKQGYFTLYWTYPPVVEQGSINGKMNSAIDGKQKSMARMLKRNLTLMYKQCIYFFR